MENYIFFGLKLGSGFEEPGGTPGGTPPPRIPRTPLPPSLPPNSNSSAHVTIQFTQSFPFVTSVLPFKLFCCVFVNLTRHQSEGIQSTLDNSNLQGKSKKVRVIGTSKKIAESKIKNSFYCTVNILITFNCSLNVKWKLKDTFRLYIRTTNVTKHSLNRACVLPFWEEKLLHVSLCRSPSNRLLPVTINISLH